jgi:hypothetical protein
MFPEETPPTLSRLVRRLERESQPQSKATRVVTTPRLTVLSKNLMREAAVRRRRLLTPLPIATAS